MEIVKPFQTTTDTISKIPAKNMSVTHLVIQSTLRCGKLKFTKKTIIATQNRESLVVFAYLV
jgi:hypothetical protein